MKCPHCKYASSEKGSLNKHIKAVHFNIKDNMCELCLFATSRKSCRVNFVSNFIFLILFLWLVGITFLVDDALQNCVSDCVSVSISFLSMMGVSVSTVSIPSLFTDGRSLYLYVFAYSTYVSLFRIRNSLATTLDTVLNGSIVNM